MQFKERKREKDREREEKDNIETTKTEKLCHVQHFSSLLLLATSESDR